MVTEEQEWRSGENISPPANVTRGLIHRSGVICRLSLLLVLVLSPMVFSGASECGGGGGGRVHMLAVGFNFITLSVKIFDLCRLSVNLI